MLVNVGLGVHLEMSLEEARSWTSKAVESLQLRIDALSKQIV